MPRGPISDLTDKSCLLEWTQASGRAVEGGMEQIVGVSSLQKAEGFQWVGNRVASHDSPVFLLPLPQTPYFDETHLRQALTQSEGCDGLNHTEKEVLSSSYEVTVLKSTLEVTPHQRFIRVLYKYKGDRLCQLSCQNALSIHICNEFCVLHAEETTGLYE